MTDTQEAAELLPCPFCGGIASIICEVIDGVNEGEPEYQIYAVSCDNNCLHWVAQEQEAYEQWNRRTAATLAYDWKRIETEADFPTHQKEVWVTVRSTGEVTTNGFPPVEYGRSDVFIEVYSAWMEIDKPKPYTASQTVQSDEPLKSPEAVRSSRRKTMIDTQEAAEPVDLLLFCPNCFEQHVDEDKPDVCENCGFDTDSHHDVDAACRNFEAWLNPPHKSHRCNFCNHVWRPADVPTNGVQLLKTKGQNDESPKPVAFANGKDFDDAVKIATCAESLRLDTRAGTGLMLPAKPSTPTKG